MLQPCGYVVVAILSCSLHSVPVRGRTQVHLKNAKKISKSNYIHVEEMPSKAGVTRDVYRQLIGNCQYAAGIEPGELTPMISCVGVDSIGNPQLNDGKQLM